MKTTVQRLATMAMAVLSAVALAGTYYVDLNAPAGGNGLINSPFQSFRQFYGTYGTDGTADTVYMADGTYNNAIENWSGAGQFNFTSGGITVFGGYGGWNGATFDTASRTTRTTVFRSKRSRHQGVLPERHRGHAA